MGDVSYYASSFYLFLCGDDTGFRSGHLVVCVANRELYLARTIKQNLLSEIGREVTYLFILLVVVRFCSKVGGSETR